MKTLLIFPLLGFVVGCAPDKKYVSIEPSAEIYVRHFASISQFTSHPVVIDNLVVQMNDALPDDVLAECVHSETPTVLINSSNWPYLTVQSQEQVIDHELGHCLLGRVHQDADVTVFDLEYTQIQASLMNAYHLPDWLYVSNYNAYINELFSENMNQNWVLVGPDQFPYSAMSTAASKQVIPASSKVQLHMPDGSIVEKTFRCVD